MVIDGLFCTFISEYPAKFLRKVLTSDGVLTKSSLAENRKLMRRTTICEFSSIYSSLANEQPASTLQNKILLRRTSVGKECSLAENEYLVTSSLYCDFEILMKYT